MAETKYEIGFLNYYCDTYESAVEFLNGFGNHKPGQPICVFYGEDPNWKAILAIGTKSPDGYNIIGALNSDSIGSMIKWYSLDENNNPITDTNTFKPIHNLTSEDNIEDLIQNGSNLLYIDMGGGVGCIWHNGVLYSSPFIEDKKLKNDLIIGDTTYEAGTQLTEIISTITELINPDDIQVDWDNILNKPTFVQDAFNCDALLKKSNNLSDVLNKALASTNLLRDVAGLADGTVLKWENGALKWGGATIAWFDNEGDVMQNHFVKFVSVTRNEYENIPSPITDYLYFVHEGTGSNLQYQLYIGPYALKSATYKVEQLETPEEGAAATYVLKDSNDVVCGVPINIPKDKVVETAELKVVEEEDVPYEGAHIGDKYIDITFENQISHVYIPVQDLVDIYYGDGSTINVNNHIISSLIWERGGGENSIQIVGNECTTEGESAVNLGINSNIDSNSPYSVILGGSNNIQNYSGNCLMYGNSNELSNARKSIVFGDYNYATVVGSHMVGTGHTNYGKWSHIEGIGEIQLNLSVMNESTKSYFVSYANPAHESDFGDISLYVIHEGNYISSGNNHGSHNAFGTVKILSVNYSYDYDQYYVVLDSVINTNLSWFTRGFNTTAFSHVEGVSNTNCGPGAHMEGQGNFNGGEYSTIEGQNNANKAPISFIGGCKNTNEYTSNASVLFGVNNTNKAPASAVFGANNTNESSNGGNIIAGYGNINLGGSGTAIFGDNNTSSGDGNLVVGLNNKVAHAYGGFISGLSNDVDASMGCNVIGIANTMKKTSAGNPNYGFIIGNSNEIWTGGHQSFILGVNNVLNAIKNRVLYNNSKQGFTNTSYDYWKINFTSYDCKLESGKTYKLTINNNDVYDELTAYTDGDIVYIGEYYWRPEGVYMTYNPDNDNVELSIDGSLIDDMSSSKYVYIKIEEIKGTASGAYTYMYGDSNAVGGSSYETYVIGTYNQICCNYDVNNRNITDITGSPTHVYVYGAYNKLSGSDAYVTVFGVGHTINSVGYATILGNSNKVTGISTSALITGTDNTIYGITRTDGMIVAGSKNTISQLSDTTGAIIAGSSNTITNTGGFAMGAMLGYGNIHRNGYYHQGVIFGINNTAEYSCTSNVLFGYNNKACNMFSSIITGSENKVGYYTNSGGTEVSTISQDFMYVNGSNNNVYSNVSFGIVSGSNNTLNDSQFGFIRGSLNKISYGNGGTVFGYNNYMNNSTYSFINGVYNTVYLAHASLISGEDHYVESSRCMSIEGGKHHVGGGYYSHIEGFGGQKLEVSIVDEENNTYRVSYDNTSMVGSLGDILYEGFSLVNDSMSFATPNVKILEIVGIATRYVTIKTDVQIDLDSDLFLPDGLSGFGSHIEGICNMSRGKCSHINGINNVVDAYSKFINVNGMSNTVTNSSNVSVISCRNLNVNDAENMVFVPGLTMVDTDGNTDEWTIMTEEEMVEILSRF